MKLSTVYYVIRSKIAALTYPSYRKAYKQQDSKLKIKLVAIAKNEAAYLAEWVYHHLHFGISAIEVHYNGCNDNTLEVAEGLHSEPVSFINADAVFENSRAKPQIEIYRNAFRKAKEEGFDHVMFLDIDEFWVPYDLTTSISDFIQSAPYFDVMSFQWANKVKDHEAFSPAISDATNVQPARQLKSVYKTFITPGLLNPHNIMDNALIRIESSFNKFTPTNRYHSLAAKESLPPKAFILHRKYRSQVEYVASLDRGGTARGKSVASKFKSNRAGFENKKTYEVIQFPAKALESYRASMSNQLRRLEEEGMLVRARETVMQRYFKVLDNIRSAPPQESFVIEKILKNITLKDADQALVDFRQRHDNK